MKKITALLLSLCMALMLLQPMAAAEEAKNALPPSYFNVEFDILDGKTVIDADFMIPSDRSGVYINAEDLARLSGRYDFALSYQQCAFVDDETQHAVMFKFDSKDVSSYILGANNRFEAPLKTVFDGTVAWVPFDTGVQLLNCDYYVFNDGTAGFVQAEINTLTALSALAYEKDNLAFDWCREVGYDGFNNFVMSASAKTVNFFQGLLTGDTWSALLVSVPSGTEVFAREYSNAIADVFVTSSKSELSACTGAVLSGTESTKKIVSGMETVTDMAHFSIGIDFISKILSKYEKLDINKLLGAEKVLNNTVDAVNNGLSEGLTAIDGILLCVTMLSYYAKFENADQVSVSALRRYSEKTSLKEGRFMHSYSLDMQNEQSGAVDRFLTEKGSTIVVECTKTALETAFKSVLAGPSAIAMFWELASNFVPLLKDTLDSTKSFSTSEVAIDYQNDALAMWKASCVSAFTSSGINENKLEDVVLDAYTYLKFSLIARGFAESCINSSTSLEQYTKNMLIANMGDINEKTSTYLSCIVDREYGALLGDFEKDRPDIMSHITANGERIEASVMENTPVLDMSGFPGDEEGAVTVDEAIELTAATITNLWSLIGGWGIDGWYTYEYVGDVLADDSIPSYLIAARMDESYSPSLYAVPYHGKEVWMVSKLSDGSYYCYTDVDMSRLSWTKLIEIILTEIIKEIT